MVQERPLRGQMQTDDFAEGSSAPLHPSLIKINNAWELLAPWQNVPHVRTRAKRLVRNIMDYQGRGPSHRFCVVLERLCKNS